MKIFISYSHDSPEHSVHVLAFSDRLRSEGIDCHIDQYEESPPEGWPRWMHNQIKKADFVLVICTEKYRQRFQGEEETGKGLGANWEGAIITQHLYDNEAKSTKFIPVVFSFRDLAYIPTVLRGSTHYELDTEEGYEKLYRRLTDQASVVKPELGKLRSLPPLPRKQDFTGIIEDRRESLPYSHVVIGTLKRGVLAVDVRAEVFLEEKIRPPIGIFADRVSLDDPYCPKCSRPLAPLHASWMADGVQIGYQCRSCLTEIRGTRSDVLSEARGEIRRNYEKYWQNYQNAIQELTGGEPHKFRVP
jgi:hypothetical protein